MKKFWIGLLVFTVLIGAVMTSALADDIHIESTSSEYYELIPTYIDGEKVALSMPAYLVDETTYVPLRALSNALGATDVLWDSDVATIYAPELTVTVDLYKTYIEANGRCFYVPTGIIMIDESMYMPIRPLCKAFGAEVEWLDEERSVNIVTGSGHCASADEYYNSDDLYWLSRIIYAESGNQCLVGKIAVGTVVMNRVESSLFPNTIYDVIFDFSCGVQFSPAANGTIYNTPNAESVVAAKLVLDGAREVENGLFFASVKDCWAAYNRPYITTIQDHDFYA